MDEAERCGRLALMNRGRIIAEGTPAEIKGRGQTRMFRVEAHPVSKAVDLAPQHPAVANAAVFGDELQFGLAEADADQAGAVVTWLREQGLTCGEPRPVRIAIEHAFLELLRRDEAEHAGAAA
jgi:ABC-2 type transport system ATP-binding protein